MDFEGAKVGGGANELAKIVKAFAGAGIVNRILAVFDNDTAAEAALHMLADVRLPDNITVLRYPDIDLARAYPTLGPSGRVTMDVNGLAGSIELYLGEDVLRDDGGLTPVEWRGYERAVGKYQGEVISKSEVHSRFERMLSACEGDRSLIARYDWTGILAILNGMRKAFHTKDARRILEDLERLQ